MGKCIGGLFCIALVVAGGLVGWKTTTPRFRSTGLIQIRRTLPPLLYECEVNGPLPDYEMLMRAQVAMIKTSDVIRASVYSDPWRAELGRQPVPRDMAAFAGSLTVIHPPETDQIEISFLHADRGAARTGVNLVIENYMELYGGAIGDRSERLMKLKRLEQGWRHELETVNRNIDSLTRDLGEDVFEERYMFQVKQLNKLEEALNEANLQLTLLKSKLKNRPTEKPPDVESDTELEVQESRVALLTDMHKRAQEAVKVAVNRRQQLGGLREERERLTRILDGVRKRIHVLNVERENRDRVSVISRASVPLDPESDKRAELALVGALLGLLVGLPLSTALAWSVRRRRLSHG